MQEVEVIFSPALIPFYNIKGKIAVVIDILRATTTICEALQNGARAIIPVESTDEAKRYQSQGFLTAAERDGLVAEGFELGNSPHSFTKEVVNNREVVITTTNGTRALLLCKDAEEVLIGSFFNLKAICEYVMKQDKDLVLVCAGWKNKFNLEDSVFAGAVISGTMPHYTIDSDAAQAALQLYQQGEQSLESYLENCNHARRFAKLGIHDLSYCLELNKTTFIPEYREGKIAAKQVQAH